jgi:phage terminase large subunit-like protein
MTAAPAWNLSCPDWKARLREHRSLLPDLPLNREAADRAVAVFNKLRLFDVPGTPTMEEAGGEWFREIVRAIFGSYDPAARWRYIRELFLLVSKKQNKTTGGALLMLTFLLLNERPRAPMLFTGPVQKTADDAFAAAEGAIALDNVLNKKLHVRDHLKTIVHRETGAKLKILTFDPDIVTGEKVVAALSTRSTCWARCPRAKKAMVQLRGGMAPFPEAFLAIITTQSDEPPAGVFAEDLERARAIRDGKRAGPYAPGSVRVPEGDAGGPGAALARPEELADGDAEPGPVHPAAHPHRVVRGGAAERRSGPAHVGLAAPERADRHGAHRSTAGPAPNSGSAGAKAHARRDAERSEVVAIGIDGGGLDDLLGLAVLGRCRQTRRWLLWTHAWAHQSVLERRKSEAARFEDFQRDGDLTIVQQLGEDLDDVADVATRVYEAGLLDKIGCDPAGVGGILDALVAAGIPEDKVIGVSQGWRLGGAIKTAERKLAEGVLVHGGQRLMAWCVGNAKVEPRGNAILITKQASGTAKIDPLMAMFDAVSLMALNPAPTVDVDMILANPLVF